MAPDNNKTTHIRLKNCSSECNRLYEFLAENLESLPVTIEFRNDLKLVAEELLANIINHGYEADEEHPIDVDLNLGSNRVQLTFTDSGVAFNPLGSERPELFNDLSEGGMGILLVKSLTDEQHYRRDGDLNVFSVTKNYNK